MAIKSLNTPRILLLILLNLICWIMVGASAASSAITSRMETSLELNSSLNPGADGLYSSATTPPAFMLSYRPTLTTNTQFHLCISFVIDVSTPGLCVWTANRDRPVSISASLKLTSSGDLVLSESRSGSSPTLVWSSDTAGLGVVRALLLESGNLVLVGRTSNYVWQSFDHPTDTLLPGQDFTSHSTSLISNKKAGDLSSGRFFLSFGGSAQTLQLSSNSSSEIYWDEWGQIDFFNFDQFGNVLLFNSHASVNATHVANDRGNITATRRMTLDVDGNLRMYTWNATLARWIAVWMALPDVCEIGGLCGNYGVCTYNLMQPTCICPPGFSVIDQTDLAGGCSPDNGSNTCGSSKYVELENVDYPFNDLYHNLSQSVDECKDICTHDCACKAAVYWQSESYGKCWIKHDVLNGRTYFAQKWRVFLKISASDPLAVSEPVLNTAAKWTMQNMWQLAQAIMVMKRKDNLGVVIALAVLIAIQALCFAGTVVVLIGRCRRQLEYLKRQYREVEGTPLVCSYEELRVATKNFSHRLGAGGFGTVYKGELQNGQVVAVKQLEGLSPQERQFRAEIMTIGRIHHINLVRLVGFCSEGAHRLLVYEYMEGGSVDQLLFEKGLESGRAGEYTQQQLDWKRRFQICVCVARGIHYLHEECLDCILHCDIKPQNILLDRNFCPKVADFGLAYLYSRDRTVSVTTVRGTRGYLAPEWVSNLPITAKADVYSYGMLLMEIVSGRHNYLSTESAMMEANEKWCFPLWAYGKPVEHVMDPRLDQLSTNLREVEAVLKVGFACIQADMQARPSMGQVVRMLEGTLPVPHALPPATVSRGPLFPSSFSSAAAGSSSSKETFEMTRSLRDEISQIPKVYNIRSLSFPHGSPQGREIGGGRGAPSFPRGIYDVGKPSSSA